MIGFTTGVGLKFVYRFHYSSFTDNNIVKYKRFTLVL